MTQEFLDYAVSRCSHQLFLTHWSKVYASQWVRLWLRFLHRQDWKSSLNKRPLFSQTGWLLVTGQELWSSVRSAFLLGLGFVVVWSLSLVWLFVTSWTATCQAPLSSTILPEFAQMHIHWVGGANHLFFCCLFVILPSIFPSFKVFSNESALLISCPKNWSFSNSSSNKYSRFIYFRINQFDGDLRFKGLSRVFSGPTIQKQQFFVAQPSLWSNSHIWKTIALIIWTFVGNMMSLLFNMLCRFVIAREHIKKQRHHVANKCPGDSAGQRSLECCNSWGWKVVNVFFSLISALKWNVL